MIGGYHFANTAALHDLTDADPLGIVCAGTHAPPHIRIDGKPPCLDEDLTGSGIGHRLRIRSPVVGGRHALWVAGEKPPVVHHILHRSAFLFSVKASAGAAAKRATMRTIRWRRGW